MITIPLSMTNLIALLLIASSMVTFAFAIDETPQYVQFISESTSNLASHAMSVSLGAMYFMATCFAISAFTMLNLDHHWVKLKH